MSDLRNPAPAPDPDLKAALAAAWESDRPHVERLTLAAAVIQDAFRRAGLSATLVGGGAIEFYSPGGYVTGDLDFIVETYARERVDAVLTLLGLEQRGRHWVRGDLFVEVPGSWLSDPADEFPVGPFLLRVIRKEYLVGERIVGFRHWKSWAYGQQAAQMIAAFGDELDESVVRAWLKREGAEDAFDLLKGLAASGIPITTPKLDEIWHQRYAWGRKEGDDEHR